MLSNAGNVLVTAFFLVAAMGAAVLAGLIPDFDRSRKTAIVLNALGAALVAVTMILIRIFWDLDIVWLANLAYMLSMIAGGIIAVNFLGLYQENRIARNGKSTLDKLRVNKARP